MIISLFFHEQRYHRLWMIDLRQTFASSQQCRMSENNPQGNIRKTNRKNVYRPTKQGYVLVPLYDIPEMEIGLKSIMAERFGAETAKSMHCRL